MKPPSGPQEARRQASDISVFASSCTLHGLSHVFGQGSLTPRRGLWAVAVFLSMAAFLYQVAERVHYYGEFHHETALDERESHQLTFPAITLCNINPLRRSRLTPNDLHWAGPSLLGLEPSEHAAFLRALGQPPTPPGFMPSPTFDMARLYTRAGHTLEDMLLDCRYRGRPCGPENFTAVSWPPTLSHQRPRGAQGLPSQSWQPRFPPKPGNLNTCALGPFPSQPGCRPPPTSTRLSVETRKLSSLGPLSVTAGLECARSHLPEWGTRPGWLRAQGCLWKPTTGGGGIQVAPDGSGPKTPLSAREGLVSLCFLTCCQSWRGATGTHCFPPQPPKKHLPCGLVPLAGGRRGEKVA